MAAAHALGAILMLVAMAVCIRALADRLPAGDITFYRAVFGLLLLLPLVFGGGRGWRGARSRPSACRSSPCALFTYLAIVGYFYAPTKIPMAEAISLSATLPILMTALAALILREAMRKRASTAAAR